MEIKAKVVGVLPLESGTGRNGEWKRATVIVEYLDGDYPHKVALTNIKNAESFSRIAVDSTGTFNINLNSREYQSKWHTTCDCWQWRLDENTQKRKRHQREPQQQPQVAPVSAAPQATASDDLPF